MENLSQTIKDGILFGIVYGVVRLAGILAAIALFATAIVAILGIVLGPAALLAGSVVAAIPLSASALGAGAFLALFGGIIGAQALGAIFGTNILLDAIAYGIIIYAILGTLLLWILGRLNITIESNIVRVLLIAIIPYFLRLARENFSALSTLMFIVFLVFEIAVVWFTVKIAYALELDIPDTMG